MTVREYLLRPEAIRREISRLKTRIDTLRRLSSNLSVPIREINIRTAPDPFRTQSLLAEAADGEREILALEEALNRAVEDTVLYILQLPDSRMHALLAMRYLEGYCWDDITARMGYGRTTVFRLHQQALDLLPPPPDAPDGFPGPALK